MSALKSITVSPALRRLLVDRLDQCSADCCHSLAFTISDFDVRLWYGNERIDRYDEITTELRELVSSIRDFEGKIDFDIREVESSWESSEALSFFTILYRSFEKVRDDLVYDAVIFKEGESGKRVSVLASDGEQAKAKLVKEYGDIPMTISNKEAAERIRHL